jgi:hypothetical protein
MRTIQQLQREVTKAERNYSKADRSFITSQNAIIKGFNKNPERKKELVAALKQTPQYKNYLALKNAKNALAEFKAEQSPKRLRGPIGGEYIKDSPATAALQQQLNAERLRRQEEAAAQQRQIEDAKRRIQEEAAAQQRQIEAERLRQAEEVEEAASLSEPQEQALTLEELAAASVNESFGSGSEVGRATPPPPPPQQAEGRAAKPSPAGQVNFIKRNIHSASKLQQKGSPEGHFAFGSRVDNQLATRAARRREEELVRKYNEAYEMAHAARDGQDQEQDYRELDFPTIEERRKSFSPGPLARRREGFVQAAIAANVAMGAAAEVTAAADAAVVAAAEAAETAAQTRRVEVKKALRSQREQGRTRRLEVSHAADSNRSWNNNYTMHRSLTAEQQNEVAETNQELSSPNYSLIASEYDAVSQASQEIGAEHTAHMEASASVAPSTLEASAAASSDSFNKEKQVLDLALQEAQRYRAAKASRQSQSPESPNAPGSSYWYKDYKSPGGEGTGSRSHTTASAGKARAGVGTADGETAQSGSPIKGSNWIYRSLTNPASSATTTHALAWDPAFTGAETLSPSKPAALKLGLSTRPAQHGR